MSADYDFDLGTLSFPVTTRSDEAQRWFDRGLAWCYAFAHEEAVRCFRRAAEHDPDCAMAWWGVAIRVRTLLQQAVGEVRPGRPGAHAAHRPGCRPSLARPDRRRLAPIERALVEAIARRYPSSEPGDFARWNDDYAAAMREAYRSHPDDPDL